MTTSAAGRRLLLVHAHPDDETIGTGATMARYAAEGAHVTLITCTLGEEGEILVPELGHLAADQQDGLGKHRIGELADACAALGVSDHRFLGGPGRYRDSGMIRTPANERPDTFWQAPIEEPIRDLVRVIRELRPQVVVTYDENGGYGHPDHVRANQVTVAAVEAAADPAYYPGLGEPWDVAKLYYTAVSKKVLQQGIEQMRASGAESLFGEGVESAEDLPFGVPDEVITTEVDAVAFMDAKVAAMRAHTTQIQTDGPFFALSNGIGREVMGREQFVLCRGATGPLGESGREDDLFAGVEA